MYKNPIDIKFYNYWGTFLTENLPHRMWLYRFMKNREIKTNPTFFSVFGYRWFLKKYKGKKVFFSGENLSDGCLDKRLLSFSDHCLNEVDLSLGYDYIKNPKYMRFPLWIMYFVKPEMSYKDLEKQITSINASSYRLNKERTQFTCQISHHDKNGIRKKLINLCNEIDQVTCAGNFMNTTEDLLLKYKDDKQKYLRNFKFNICPENASNKGYVTEKIIDAFVGGCIPIYWGGGKKEWIEPDIFNHRAFLYYEEGNEEELLLQIEELWENKEKYTAFIEHPPFMPNAAEIIWQKITELEKRLRHI